MTYVIRCKSPFAPRDFLSKGEYEKIFSDRSGAIATAIEAMPDNGDPVQVIEVETGLIIFDSSEEEFEENSGVFE